MSARFQSERHGHHRAAVKKPQVSHMVAPPGRRHHHHILQMRTQRPREGTATWELRAEPQARRLHRSGSGNP